MVLAVAVALLAPAAATVAADQVTPQQAKMATCNKQAGDQKLSGDARKTFMSQCLSGNVSTQATGATAATTKEQSCATDADQKKLAGAARTSFLKKCVGG